MSPTARKLPIIVFAIVFSITCVLGALSWVLLRRTGLVLYEYLTSLWLGLFFLISSAAAGFSALTVSGKPADYARQVFTFVFAFILLVLGVWVLVGSIVGLIGAL